MRLRQPHPQRISPKGFMHEAQTRNGVLCVLSGKKVLGSSSRPFVDQKEVAVAVLRGPSGTERSCRCSCRSPWPSVSSVDKRCCRCSSSRPFADQKEVAVAVLRIPSTTEPTPTYQMPPKGLPKISSSRPIRYNYNQCLSLLKPKIREPHKNRDAGPPLA